MKKTKKWIFYILYILTATGFFLFYLFPSEAAKQYLTAYFKRANPSYNIKIDEIRPVLPISLLFQNVELQHRDAPLFMLDQVKLTPNPVSFFQSKLTFFFQGNAYDGMIKGKFNVIKKRQAKTVSADANFSDIHLTEMPVVKDFTGNNISGKLNGRLIYSISETGSETINALLHVSNFKMDMINPFMNIKSLTFNNIEVDFKALEDNFIIRRCTLKGPQMDGQLSGSILFKSPLEESILNIAGRVKPHHLLLAGIGKDFQSLFFSKIKGIKSGIKFKITGTIKKPGFYLQ
jgi:type II secretion system protein N